jgi:gliding motility-associated-like protein
VTEDLIDILPGQYAVTITGQNGCIWSSTFQVDGSLPLQINLVTNVAQTGTGYVTITATLNVSLQSIDTIIWLPAELFNCNGAWCLEQTIPRPDTRTEIKVFAVDTNGCMAQAALFLESIADPEVYIPNVFSPNGDGINDRFTVFGNPDVDFIEEMQIFDRWGNQVFIATEFPPNEEYYGWDGTFRHEPMNPAVFVYWARVRFADGKTGSFKGDVTLVR